MRNTLLTSVLLASIVAMSSCGNDEEEYTNPGTEPQILKTFTSEGSDQVSKTALSGNDVLFESGDSVSIFDGTYTNCIFSTTGSGAEVQFTGKVTPSDNYYVLYPYSSSATFDGTNITATLPSKQTAIAGTFDPNAALSVAAFSGTSFKLMNVSTVLKFTTEAEYTKVEISSNSSESIAGDIKITNFSAPTYCVTSGASTVTMTASSGNIAAGTYYAVILPTTLSTGFTLRFYDSDGNSYIKSISSSVTFSRNKLMNLGTMSNLTKEEAEGTYTLYNATTPAQVAKAMGLGWNLGNHCDSWYIGRQQGDSWVCGEAYDKSTATQATFDAIAAAGIKTVRIPVTWWIRSTWESFKDQVTWTGAGSDGWYYITDITDYKTYFTGDFVILQSWLTRVHEIVTYAKNAGLNVIINMHHDGADSDYWLSINDAVSSTTYNDYVKKQIKAFWTQIGTEFADEDEYLIFEGFNEIHDGTWGGGNDAQYAILDEWEKIFVETVRGLGGNNATRWLSVPSYQTTPEKALKMNLPDDDKLMVAVHYYANYKFSLQPNANGVTVWGDDSWATDCGETYTKSTFNSLKTAFIDNGIPMYVGEIGCVAQDNATYQKYRIYMLEYCSRVLHDCSMCPILWDNNSTSYGDECHGYFDHSTGAWINETYSKPVIEAMLKAVNSTDSDYDLDYIYTYMNPNKGTYRGY